MVSCRLNPFTLTQSIILVCAALGRATTSMTKYESPTIQDVNATKTVESDTGRTHGGYRVVVEVSLQTDVEDSSKPTINGTHETVHDKFLVKRSANHRDKKKEYVTPQERRRRLLKQRYRLFRLRKLNKDKSSNNDQKATGTVDRQRGTRKLDSYNHNKEKRKSAKPTVNLETPAFFDKVTSTQKIALSLSEKYDENFQPTQLSNARRRNQLHRPTLIHAQSKPAASLKMIYNNTKKTSSKEKNFLSKTTAEHQNFKDYKYKNIVKLKRLRSKRKYQKPKTERNSDVEEPKASNTYLQTSSSSSALKEPKYNEISPTPKTPQQSTTSTLQKTTTATGIERRLISEMTTKTPFLSPTRALDYLTSFESMKRPKRWPLRLILPVDDVKTAVDSNAIEVKIDTLSLKEPGSTSVEIPSSVSGRSKKEDVDNWNVLTREKSTKTKKKSKKGRKGTKGKRRRINKHKRQKRLKKRKRHLKTSTILPEKSKPSSPSLSPENNADPSSQTTTFALKNITELSQLNEGTTISFTEAGGSKDQSSEDSSRVKNSIVTPKLSESTTTTVQDQTLQSTDDVRSRIFDSGGSSPAYINVSFDTDAAETFDNATKCQNLFTCIESPGFNYSSAPSNSSSEILLFNILQNSTAEESLLADVNMDNETQSLYNLSFIDELLVGHENGNKTISQLRTTSSMSSNAIETVTTHSNFSHAIPGQAPVLANNLSSKVNFTFSSGDNSNYFALSSTKISTSETTTSSFLSKLGKSTFPKSKVTKLSSSPSSSPSLMTLSSSSPTSEQTSKATLLRSTSSSISRWRQWALKRRRKLNKGKNKEKEGRSKSDGNRGSKKSKKVGNTQKYDSSRGSVAGSLVVVDGDLQKTSRAPTPSTKSPFIGYKTAYDFLSGQKKLRKVDMNEERRESYELNRVMAENMCKVFGKQFVSTNIGGKCV